MACVEEEGGEEMACVEEEGDATGETGTEGEVEDTVEEDIVMTAEETIVMIAEEITVHVVAIGGTDTMVRVGSELVQL